MIDVHCHLVDAKYQDIEVQRIVDEARGVGVEMITQGTSVENSGKNLEVANNNDGVWTAIGVHPEEKYDASSIIYELKQMASEPKVVAIGEIGLDYREDMSVKEKAKQKELFEIQIDLAGKTDLPAVVHNRGADEDIYSLLKARVSKFNKILLHCFSGDLAFMEKMAELGCYFSFGGMITYKKNEALREVARQVPENRLLLETDAPYLPPEPVRGTVNTPANVKIVAEKMAEIRSVSRKRIEILTTRNAHRLFSKLK